MEESWPHGVAITPDGERAREFVQRTPVWSSAIFVSEHGTAYRRHMGSRGFTSWELIPLTEDESGRFGYALPGFVSVETAIATAWHPRAPGSRRHAVVLDPHAELHASNVAWREPEVVLDGDDHADETWQPLTWRIGIASCDGLLLWSKFSSLFIGLFGPTPSTHPFAISPGLGSIAGPSLPHFASCGEVVHPAAPAPPRRPRVLPRVPLPRHRDEAHELGRLRDIHPSAFACVRHCPCMPQTN